MARELAPAHQPLNSDLAISDEQAAAIRRLVNARPAAHHEELLAALGLNPNPDQP